MMTAPTRGAALLAAVLIAAGAAAQTLPSDELLANPQAAARRFDGFRYTLAERTTEAAEKVARLRKALKAQRFDGLLISTERNLNWLTAGGKDNVVWAQRESPVKLLVTSDRLYLVADNIEGPRLMKEEVAGLGYQWARYDWYGAESTAVDPLIRGKRIAFDQPQTAVGYKRNPDTTAFDVGPLYYPITAGELKKYRWLGKKTAEVLEQVAQAVRPGMTEWDVQYLLSRELWYWDIFPTVVLSAVDDRFTTFRHPVVVGRKLKNYVALNVCTRRWGLVVSTTRLVHFGDPPAKLRQAWEEGPKVMAAMWAASKPGKTLGDAIAAGQKAYRGIGFPGEWRLHHQGGQIGYIERLYLVKPGDRVKITPGMVLAWNPTVQGSKFEDTVVVRPDGTLENLTKCSASWPTTEVSAGGATYAVPGLLIRAE